MNYQRTWIALVLTVLAVALPCTAWFFLGIKSVEKEATSLGEHENKKLAEIASYHAKRINEALSQLRISESYQPFYYYQKSYYDLKDRSERTSPIFSPLAETVSDPLIETYFQINPQGKMTFFAPRVSREYGQMTFDSIYQPHISTIQGIAHNQAATFMGRIASLSS